MVFLECGCMQAVRAEDNGGHGIWQLAPLVCYLSLRAAVCSKVALGGSEARESVLLRSGFLLVWGAKSDWGFSQPELELLYDNNVGGRMRNGCSRPSFPP